MCAQKGETNNKFKIKMKIDHNYSDKFEKVYKEYYLLHPDGDSLPKSKFYYLHRQWFFPNHIDLVLENIEKFHSKFYPNADKTVALFAGLLHDAGLVYKRVEISAEGHENRSCEYARLILTKYNIGIDLIDKICEAIEATDSNNLPTLEESLLVRNADAYSHLVSLHFFAKAYFSDELDYFIEWFTKKIESTSSKLTIPELIDDINPLVERYRSMINIYNRHRGKTSI